MDFIRFQLFPRVNGLKKKIALLSIFGSFLILGTASALPFRLSIRVYDQKKREFAGATVRLNGLSIPYNAESKSYAIQKSITDSGTILVSCNGFVTQRRHIKSFSNEYTGLGLKGVEITPIEVPFYLFRKGEEYFLEGNIIIPCHFDPDLIGVIFNVKAEGFKTIPAFIQSCTNRGYDTLSSQNCIIEHANCILLRRKEGTVKNQEQLTWIRQDSIVKDVGPIARIFGDSVKVFSNRLTVVIDKKIYSRKDPSEYLTDLFHRLNLIIVKQDDNEYVVESGKSVSWKIVEIAQKMFSDPYVYKVYHTYHYLNSKY
jgi:hypothetical protein